MAKPPKPTNKKKDIRELPSDIGQAWEQTRILNKKALQDVEISCMRKIQEIYLREINRQVPDQLEIIKKTWTLGGFKNVAFYEPKIKVLEGDFNKKKWLNLMKDHQGFFKYEAEQIVKIVCEFQLIKYNRKFGSGNKTDPENLFGEEVKHWATYTLSVLDCTMATKELILKRCRYFEEILCEDGLFDRPNSRITHTIQQVIVAVRGILKYRTIPIIERELAHHDARKAFDGIKKHLIMLMSDTLEFCANVFRTSKAKGEADRMSELMSVVMSSQNVSLAFPDDQAEIREQFYCSNPNKGQLIPSHTVLSLGEKGSLMLSSGYVCKDKNAQLQQRLVRLTDNHLTQLFVGSESGMEIAFQSNPRIAEHYLKALALVMEVGDFFAVVDKAAACASQGGTLLVYGLANAQLNIMLETCEHLMSQLRETCSNLTRIAELRFEELVFQNSATVKRNPWIIHYRSIHSTLARIDKTMSSISQETALVKSQANSMTLYDMFQKASEDTESFLAAATSFAKHVSTALGMAYQEPPVSQSIVSLPTVEDLKTLASKGSIARIETKQNTPVKAITNSSSMSSSNTVVNAAQKEQEEKLAMLLPPKELLEGKSKKKEKKHKSKKKREKPVISPFSSKKFKDKSTSEVTVEASSEFSDYYSSMDDNISGGGSSGNDTETEVSNRSNRSSRRTSLSASAQKRPTVSDYDDNPFNDTVPKSQSTATVTTTPSTKQKIHTPLPSSSSNPFDDILDIDIGKGKPVLAYNDSLFNLTLRMGNLQKLEDPRNLPEIVMDKQKLTSADLPKVIEKIWPGTLKIELMCNKLEGRDVATICEALQDTCLNMLHTLNLSHNSIGDDGAEVLKDYLIEDECALCCLTLSNCHITDKGVQFLCEALRKNRTLETLNLDSNLLTDESLASLEAAISANERSALVNLGLGESSDNRKFTMRGARHIWKLMKIKPDLIVVGDPPFTIDVDDLASALSSPSTSLSSSNPTSPNGPLAFAASPLLSAVSTISAVTGGRDYFGNVALEAHTRMRKRDKYNKTKDNTAN